MNRPGKLTKLTLCAAAWALFGVFGPCSRIWAERILFTADKMSGYSKENSDFTRLEGHASVKTAKIEITADSIELTGDDFRYIAASGNVRGRNIDSDMDFRCGTMKYDRQTEVATLQSDADIFDHQNKVTANAQIIEYNQKTEVAILQIDIELKQKESVCTAAFAVYRKKEQMVEMSGNPKIQRSDDIFRAREMTFNLETEEILLDGRVRGTVKDSGGGAKSTGTATTQSAESTEGTAVSPEGVVPGEPPAAPETPPEQKTPEKIEAPAGPTVGA
ncbi:MAG: organic solvent tolerance protein OstA [Spirochaetaceae bacterium]|nr:organic solvent tolerance protein OstA [Spirochaetaceae bacterium]